MNVYPVVCRLAVGRRGARGPPGVGRLCRARASGAGGRVGGHQSLCAEEAARDSRTDPDRREAMATGPTWRSVNGSGEARQGRGR